MNILKNLFQIKSKNRLIYLSLVSFLFLLCGTGKGGGKMTREPAVAGGFYPATKEELKEMLDKIFAKVEVEPIKEKIIIGISPHAGYLYSGEVAAHLYKLLKTQTFKTAIVIGPSHFLPFIGVSVYNRGMWKTPLGTIKIDEDLAKKIVSKGEKISTSPELHIKEHSIEVQIPFLQYIKGENLRIVPIMMGTQDIETVQQLSSAIYEAIKDRNDVIVIASSDLYHGYSYKECNIKDSLLKKYVEDMEVNEFMEAFSKGEIMACGGAPIATAISVARKFNAEPLVLDMTNSNDVIGQKGGYIVGYMSVAFIKKIKKTEFNLSKEEKRYLLTLARKTLSSVLRGEKPEIPKDPPEKLKREMGVFTTLKKNETLRGCIGYPLAIKPLYLAVIETAEKAGLEDPRFTPLRYNELKETEIEITVLTPLQKVKDLKEIEIGKDGLLVKYKYYQGLLLPQVPVEWNWDRETFIKQTCVKAGLPHDAYKWEGIEFYKFQGIVFSESEYK